MIEITLNGDCRPMPTKEQKVSISTEKYSGGPKSSAKLATIGAMNISMMVAKNAP